MKLATKLQSIVGQDVNERRNLLDIQDASVRAARIAQGPGDMNGSLEAVKGQEEKQARKQGRFVRRSTTS